MPPLKRKYPRSLGLAGWLALLAGCPPGSLDTTITATTGEPGATTGEPTTTQTSATPTTTTLAPTSTGGESTSTGGESTSTGGESTSTGGESTSTGDTTQGSTSDDTDTGSTTGAPLTLCERLGGPDDGGIADLVSLALANIHNDDRINGYFLNSDVGLNSLRGCLIDQLGAAVACEGITYTCKGMLEAHAGLKISQQDLDDFVLDFALALDAHQAVHPDLADADKAALLDGLAAMAPEIVEDPAGDQTVYQRVGRKPAIRALVGLPDEPGSFVDNVAVDAAINGFFGGADFDRLNTCLTRQVAGIDGPTKYGLEVDSPGPGVDPGVALGDPCKGMVAAHTGLVDANDAIGIDLADFMALVADLATAMTTAGVADADQAVILGVLGPMCEDILAPQFKNQCPSAQKTEVVEVMNINGAIVDDAYKGPIGTMFCQDLVVPADPIDFVGGVQVTTAIDHTWLSDVVIKLVNPAGDKILTLVSRPSFLEPNDDGAGCCGKSPNFSAMFPLTFRNGAPNDAETMGSTVNNTNQVVCKDDGIAPCEWHPNPGKGPGVDLDDFLGQAAAGTWKLCVGDSNGGDMGALQSVKLIVQRFKYPL